MIEKLMRELDSRTAALITSPSNRYYYTGMKTSAGFLIVTSEKACFFTDFRYITAAKAKVRKGISAALSDRPMITHIKEYLAGTGIKTILFEEGTVSYSMAQGLISALSEYELVGGQHKITAFREIKTPEEMDYIIAAQKITDESFDYICDFIHENWKNGLTEKEVALELEFYERKLGSGAMPFSIICASGLNSACPHAVPCDKKLEPGDFVTMDYGATYEGYCSDMTRTVAIEYVTEDMKKMYDTVLKAQMTALEGIHAGITGKEADSLARDVINAAGYEGYFGHSLGHSVGIDIHESPNFSQGVLTPTPENTVISVEPGVYIEGQFGVRIEDLVIVRKDGVTDITGARKDLLVL